MKKIFVILILLVILLTSCERAKNNSADAKQARKTNQMMKEAHRQVGMPNIVNFQQKKLLKMIYELCDKENLICYAYLYNAYTGKIGQFLGKCLGYGLPYSAQFSNPQREVYSGGYNRGFGSLPQPEPNGLFMPTSSSATWLIMIDPKTKKPRPVYVEPKIIVSPFPLHK